MRYIWGDALAILERRQPDLRAINLETAVTTSNDAWKGKPVTYRMHPENVECLTAAHLDYCGLANNHVLDGYAGLEETLDVLHRAGLKTAGAGQSLADARAPAVLPLPRAGIRVLVFAVGSASAGVPDEWAARDDHAGVDFLPDLSNAAADRLLDRVRNARRAATSSWPRFTGEQLGIWHPGTSGLRASADRCGRGLVHGHSSHHPKGVEVYRNRVILLRLRRFLNDYEGIRGCEAPAPTSP